MTQIQIPFMEMFREKMLSGKKTWTSRTRKYGAPGDTFMAFGSTFELVNVMEMRLGVVAWLHHRDEGCNSQEEFVECWKQIHPRKGYVPSQVVWIHQFKKKESV
jgi:hypothetical protein